MSADDSAARLARGHRSFTAARAAATLRAPARRCAPPDTLQTDAPTDASLWLSAARQLMQACEQSRATLHQQQEACTQAHERTQALLRELRSLRLGALGAAPVPAAPHASTASACPGNPPWSRAENVAVDASLQARGTPSVEVYLLGPFRVFANDRAIEEWPHGKGKSIFKYLVMHRAEPVPKDVLMETFWPGADADAARNNLNVAVHGLRKALAQADPDFAFVLFRQGCYSFNPSLRMWVDAEAFVDRVHRAEAAERQGDTAGAMAEYRVALATHHSALLVEDRYEDWLAPHRQSLQAGCMTVLQRLQRHCFDSGEFEACIGVTTRMLDMDRCDEGAHRVLMRCYSRMGQVHLALRQYRFCVDALARELNLIPSPQTVALFQQIRQRQTV